MKNLKFVFLFFSLLFFGFLFPFAKVSASDYSIEYWNTWLGESPISPSGDPTATSTASEISFFWGEGSPSGINANGFFARFTKTIYAGRYDMSVISDDGNRVYVDGSLVINSWVDQGYSSTSTATHIISSGGPHTLVVEYYENSGGAAINFDYDLTVTATYAADSNGTLSGTLTQNLTNGATGTPVTAVPNAGYHFVDWSDGSTDNPRSDASLEENISVTANFAINNYTLSYLAGTGGTLTGSTTQAINYGGDASEVSAVADTGFYFVDWSDDVTTATRTDLNISANATLTANFATTTFLLSYTAGAGGSISGDSNQTIDYGEDGSAVTAVADSAYQFSRWSDGLTSNTRTDTNVLANHSYSAIFTAIGSGHAPAVTPPNIVIPPSLSGDHITSQVSNVYQMVISDSKDFAAVSWEPYNEDYKYSEKTLYIKFRSPDGGESEIYKIEPSLKKTETIQSVLSEDQSLIEPENQAEAPKINNKAYSFSRNLKLGMQGEDVRNLQKFLNDNGFTVANQGFGSRGQETDYFGFMTKKALINFQQKMKIEPAMGYFGPVTRGVISSLK